jgi:hypothetical protein
MFASTDTGIGLAGAKTASIAAIICMQISRTYLPASVRANLQVVAKVQKR